MIEVYGPAAAQRVVLVLGHHPDGLIHGTLRAHVMWSDATLRWILRRLVVQGTLIAEPARHPTIGVATVRYRLAA